MTQTVEEWAEAWIRGHSAELEIECLPRDIGDLYKPGSRLSSHDRHVYFAAYRGILAAAEHWAKAADVRPIYKNVYDNDGNILECYVISFDDWWQEVSGGKKQP